MSPINRIISVWAVLFVLTLGLAVSCGYYYQSEHSLRARAWAEKHRVELTDTLCHFHAGDILIRPNRYWPGSSAVPNGRKYGHVAVVVKAGHGSTIDEALENTLVVEALFFDQKLKRFLFNPADQIRTEKASVSFGTKFKGIRYRLRLPLDETQTKNLVAFLNHQLNSRYNIFSLKHSAFSTDTKASSDETRPSWHCATLTWSAFMMASGIDLDGNGGVLIYPSDIISSAAFDGPGQRICF